MVIAKHKDGTTIDVKLGIFDIETLRGLFDVGIFDPDTKEWYEFEISYRRNDLFKFINFYQSKRFDYWVSFNGIGFDHQVIQYIIEEHQKWFDLSNVEICMKIHDFVQQLIDNQSYGIFLPYREERFPVKCIDLFRIHHFDNEARRTSLKWCAFMMNMDVEEMPIHHGKIEFTDSEVEMVKSYRRNDVLVTEGLLYVTLGNSLIPGLVDEYKGKNKIQDRFDVLAETGMLCLNWSDVKIGEEWNRLNYIIAENIKDERSIFPKRVIHPYGKKFKQYFPKSMKFRTQALRDFVEKLGNTSVLAEKQEFPITIGQTTYTLAKGGLHSNESNRLLRAAPGYYLRDADVGGQYPNFIIKEKVHSPHLKEAIIQIASMNVDKRTIFKEKALRLKEEGKDEEARPLMGLQEMLKLCNNGGLFGKLGQKGSFLEYPEGLLRVCLGNEIEILMLIEMMEENGIQVVSGNTDGIVCHFPQDKAVIYQKVCAEWEATVGNSKTGKLEYTDFTAMWQENINHYIGKKSNGKVKKKGRFATEFQLNKNKSKRIIMLALEEYFVNGVDPIKFITNHKDIWDFCIAKKATGQLHYEELIDDHTIPIKHKKLIRYYASNDGHIFMKRGINNEGNPMNNHCEAIDKDYPWMGQPLLKYFNKADSNVHNINHSYYILETLKRIDKIEKTKKAKSYAESFKSQTQISLF